LVLARLKTDRKPKMVEKTLTGFFKINAGPTAFAARTRQLGERAFGVSQALCFLPRTAPTNFDGGSDATSLNNGQAVSIRAIYFGPGSAIPFWGRQSA